MNADDLRKLAQDATERAKRAADDSQKYQAELERKLSRDHYEWEWARAREAVAELETKLREAASKGERELRVCSFDSSNEFPVTVTCVKRFFSYGQIKDVRIIVTHTGFPITRSMSMTTALA